MAIDRILSVDGFYLTSICVDSLNVDNIILSFPEVGYQLFYSINFHPLTHKWEVIMLIVQLFRITNVDLQYITFVSSSC